MADDETVSERPKRARRKSPSRRSSARKGAREVRGRNVDETKEAVHAEASDRTNPGGKYLTSDNRWVNGRGQEIDPDTTDVLDDDAREEARDARLAELDELADQDE